MACIFTRRSQKIEIAGARAHVCVAHEERRVKYFHQMKKNGSPTKCAAISMKKTKRKEIVKGVV